MLPSVMPMTDNEQVTNTAVTSTEVTSTEMPSAEFACEQTLDASAVFIGLVNPKTPVNVGGIMRASGCYGVDGVFYTGRRYELAARSGAVQYHVDTKDAGERIPLTGVTSLLASIPADTKLICVDLVVGATPLPDFVHPAKAFYVFGPEDGTIGQEIIDKADAVVYVPTVGCMNLAASVNVLLYDRLAKSHREAASLASNISGDELIRQSRDNNNRTRVKVPRAPRKPRHVGASSLESSSLEPSRSDNAIVITAA
ncbi:tRNA/rRNA methyltransferase (SpoU) [Shewanella baltica OS625]|uniref:tRNA/rRNA methyltransferase (SpoU) n=2 Tax=Shewanella TaxID=22 RepID=A9KTV3_SHEB9|nr:RNA methyltransferase [Shewanella baltica]ABX50008.1 tRNA/rRNA methyltransferase (SpoU) [Shewanella baltica OS195]ADT95000.1 tRNA/rRNA methyltransferase (SpoU) [Shewanella baltica OS678]EHC06181.1 tRNA/rRNA methyltransferase (SpoU) [Shewanella baltica OS625]